MLQNVTLLNICDIIHMATILKFFFWRIQTLPSSVKWKNLSQLTKTNHKHFCSLPICKNFKIAFNNCEGNIKGKRIEYFICHTQQKLISRCVVGKDNRRRNLQEEEWLVSLIYGEGYVYTNITRHRTNFWLVKRSWNSMFRTHGTTITVDA